MVTKEYVLHLLDKELDKLTAGYIDEINKLNKQLAQMNGMISKLSDENRLLQSKVIEKEATALDFQNKYEVLLQSQKQYQKSADVPNQLIDKWCESEELKDSVALLTTLNVFLEDEKELEKATYIIQLLDHNPAALLHNDPSIQNLFKQTLRKILTSEMLILSERDPSELYRSFLELLYKLNQSSLNQIVFNFLSQNFYDVLDVIAYVKAPIASVVFLKVCHQYKLIAEVQAYFHHILEKEWEDVDHNISKEEYVVLLYYAFLYDLDGLLIEKSSECSKWLDESIPDLSLYFYFYDCINKMKIPTHEEYQNKIQSFFQGTFLSNPVKEQLIAKMESIMNPLFETKKDSQKEEPKITGLEAATSHGNHIEEKLLKKNISVTERIQQSLNLLETNFQKKQYHYLERILNDLHSDLHHFGKKDRERLLSFILQFFNMKYEDSIDLDYLYRVVMSVLQQIPETHDVEMFLRNNNEIISDRILDLNDPFLISELGISFFRNNLTTILSSYLNKVIDQWAFIDANIDQRSFIRLFWITFNLGLDKRLIKVLEESAAFLEGDLPEAKIFTVYQNPNLDPVSKKVEIEGLKRNLRYFDKDESKLIFPSIDKRVDKMIMNANTHKLRNGNSHETSVPSSVRKMMYVVKLPNESPVIPGTKTTLTQEWIQLAFFNDVFFNSQPKYVSVKVLSQNQTGKVYVTSSILQEIKSMIGRKKFIDVRSFEAKENEVNNKSGNFQWPSTEIMGNGTPDSNENSLLNEVSDLKRIGYQITGLTREKRWLLLEKAVKQLGLKKVAYTIAQNVKLRKGQKNGERKFSYAISEWEYDLSKLKKHFYKNEFTWPSTKVKN